MADIAFSENISRIEQDINCPLMSVYLAFGHLFNLRQKSEFVDRYIQYSMSFPKTNDNVLIGPYHVTPRMTVWISNDRKCLYLTI